MFLMGFIQCSPFFSGSCPLTIPTTVATGNYQLRLLANDGYMVLATSNCFMVQ